MHRNIFAWTAPGGNPSNQSRPHETALRSFPRTVRPLDLGGRGIPRGIGELDQVVVQRASGTARRGFKRATDALQQD